MTRVPPRRTLAALAALASALVALAGAGTVAGDVVNPMITLGPTTIANGVAAVSGTVTGPSASAAVLTVNGQPLGLNAAGQFAGIVNLNGESVLTLSVRNPATGEVGTVNLPLTTNIVGPGGVIPPEVLSGLEQAAVTLTRPPGGFLSLGDRPISISGGVANRDQLASLKINGIDVLSLLRPNGTFTLPIPGTSREVTVVMTDRQGVSMETSYPVSRATSASARSAQGIRIASVRYLKKGVQKTKRLRMILTVKDRRGLLIRGAAVKVKSAQAGRVIGRAGAKRTTAKGTATFVLRLSSKAFGKRLVFVATAKTPSAKASKRTATRLPRLARR